MDIMTAIWTWVLSWLPQASATTLLLGAAVWLARNQILTRLTKSVGYEFDKKLEVVRSDLRAKEAEIAALRSGAMSASVSRQIELGKKRIEAAEQLWSAALDLRSAKMIVSGMAILNIDEVIKEVAVDPKVGKFVESFSFGFDLDKLNMRDASTARLFASPMAWAMYSALSAVVWHAVLTWKLIKEGIGDKKLVSDDVLLRLIKVALPHQVEFLEKYGPTAAYHLVEELEEALFKELQNMLAGEESDKEAVKRTSDIIRYSKELRDGLDKGESKPPPGNHLE